MNKISAINISVINSYKRMFKETLKIVDPKLDMEGRAEVFLQMANELIAVAVAQIKYAEIYDLLDEEQLVIALEKKKIQKEEFDRQVEKFKTLGYLSIDKYLNFLYENNNANMSSLEKFDNFQPLINYINNELMVYVSNMNRDEMIQFRKNSMTNDMDKIEDIIESVYESRISSFITNDDIKINDLVKIGNKWIHEGEMMIKHHK